MNELEAQNFTLLMGHIIGVDHAGHTYGVNNKEIERKLNDTEAIVQKIIDKMDQDTVLIVYGDHGMNDGGNHGVETIGEIRTIIFSYTKSGFPMKYTSKSV